MIAVPNLPVEVDFLVSLVEQPSDFQLMLPSAELPFNKDQWLGRLDRTAGNFSYKVIIEGNLAGHFAFLRVNGQEGTLGLVYLSPKFRATGASYKMIALAEKIAAEELDLRSLLLNVRAGNAPAHTLYLKSGYSEYTRQSDLIRMRKDLNFANSSCVTPSHGS